MSDGIERTVIVDDACGDAGVGLLIGSGSSPKKPRIAELFQAVFGGKPGTYEKHITATISGTFTHSGGPPARNVLGVEDVNQLIVK